MNIIKKIRSIHIKNYSRFIDINKAIKQIKKGNFEMIDDEAERWWLENFYIAIKETRGAKNYFKTNGLHIFTDPMCKKLISHEKIKECGHTGGTMHWTFGQFRHIYQRGPDYWLLNVYEPYFLI